MNTRLKKLIQSRNSEQFFEEIEIFSSELPKLDLNTIELRKLCEEIEERIQNTIEGAQFLKGLSEWSKKQPKKASALLDMTLLEKKLTLYLAPLLAGLSKTNYRHDSITKVYDQLKSGDQHKKLSAINALTFIKYTKDNRDKNYLKQLNNEINKAFEKDENPILIAASARRYKDLSNAKPIIIKGSKSKKIEVQLAVANALWLDIKYQDDPQMYSSVMRNLALVPLTIPAMKNGVQRILFKTANKPRLLSEYLTTFVSNANNTEEVKTISQLKYEIQKTFFPESKILNCLLSEWIISGDTNLHHGYEQILNAVTADQKIELDTNTIKPLSSKEIEYVILKIIGYTFHKEHLRSLILSILKCKPDDKSVNHHVITYISEIVAYNYKSTITYLKSLTRKKSTEYNKKTIDTIIKKSEKYYQDLNELPLLCELKTSEKRRIIYYKLEAQRTQELLNQKETKTDSFLKHIPKVQLKGGKSWFSKADGKYSNKSDLTTIEYSAELPRGLFVDPIGHTKIRYHARMLKKK